MQFWVASAQYITTLHEAEIEARQFPWKPFLSQKEVQNRNIRIINIYRYQLNMVRIVKSQAK